MKNLKYKKTIMLLSVLVGINLLFAGSSSDGSLHWGFLIMGLFGGLALFLYGMEKMSKGLKKSAGNQMRSILAKLTSNRFIALFVGAFVTMVIQSSSATTVMLVSFAQAGLMTFVQSLGVILGADIGTTITAQLVAFKLTDYALLMIAIGFGVAMFSKIDTYKYIGESILGFGLLFFGMKVMSDSMSPLRSYEGFINILEGLENPLLGIIVGTIFTALIQSSSAFTGIIIVLAQQDLITLESGIPLILGANIGTCITAGLATIGTSREAKRVALAHVMFKVAGVLLMIFWIPAFADFIRNFSNQFGSGTARQIANAHTIFNVGVGLFFLPFIGLFSIAITKLLPDKAVEKGVRPVIWHLEESSISTPALALDLARAEILRMAKILGRMLDAIIIPFRSDKLENDKIYPQLTLTEGIVMREKKIDFLDEKVTNYLIGIGRRQLSDEQTNEVYQMVSIVKDMESIGDIIEKELLALITKKHALKSDFSDEGKREIEKYHIKVCKQISRLKTAFSEKDFDKAKKIIYKESKYLELESEYRVKHIVRLQNEYKQAEETHEVYMELIDLLKQINLYTGNIAKSILKMGITDHD